MARRRAFRHQQGSDQRIHRRHSQAHRGVGFKERAPRAFKEIRKFAVKKVGTPDVLTDTRLKQGRLGQRTRNVPYGVWVRLSRKWRSTKQVLQVRLALGLATWLAWLLRHPMNDASRGFNGMVAHGQSFSCNSLGNQQHLLRQWPWRMRAVLDLVISELPADAATRASPAPQVGGVTQQSPAHSQDGEDEGILAVPSPYVSGGCLCGNRELKLPAPHPWLLSSLHASPAQVCGHSCPHCLPPTLFHGPGLDQLSAHSTTASEHKALPEENGKPC